MRFLCWCIRPKLKNNEWILVEGGVHTLLWFIFTYDAPARVDHYSVSCGWQVAQVPGNDLVDDATYHLKPYKAQAISGLASSIGQKIIRLYVSRT